MRQSMPGPQYKTPAAPHHSVAVGEKHYAEPLGRVLQPLSTQAGAEVLRPKRLFYLHGAAYVTDRARTTGSADGSTEHSTAHDES